MICLYQLMILMNQRSQLFDHLTENIVTLYLVDGERPKIWTVSSGYNERCVDVRRNRGVTEPIVSSETQ